MSQGPRSEERRSRRAFLRGPALGAASLALGLADCRKPESPPRRASAPRPARPSVRRPNVILILADDLGYGDTRCHRSDLKDRAPSVGTPHLDALGRDGTGFSAGYVTAPLCSPSRAGLLTGRYQQRFGHEHNAIRPEHGLPTTEMTLAQVLKGAGYATGLVGKWHLGALPRYLPTRRGFDEFFGLLHHSTLYIEHPGHGGICQVPSTDWPRIPEERPERMRLFRGTTPVEEPAYLTDALTREAIAFIERNRRNPFFLYLAYTAPHTPLQATHARCQRVAAGVDPRRQIYAAMVAALDDGVGALRRTLDEFGLRDTTLIMFLSDNGCATYTGACDNTPLRAGKFALFEGGIRVPFLCCWPGTLPGGRVLHTPVSSLDLLPTLASVCGATLPRDRPLDGIDLLPLLAGRRRGPVHPWLFWRMGEERAVRGGDHKLVHLADGRNLLFDLRKDPGEQRDLFRREPRRAAEFQRRLDAWQETLVPPLWSDG